MSHDPNCQHCRRAAERQRRKRLHRFQELARDRLEQSIVEMPEEQAQELISLMRKRGRQGNWYADKFEEVRREGRAQAETDETGGPMELELTLRLPTAGTVVEIPTRERQFQPGVAGARIIDSVHVADAGGLRAVELEDGLLRIELRSGEAYSFPIAELFDGEHDSILQLRETWAGTERAAYGRSVEKVRLHDVHLARVTSLRLVEPEPEEAARPWRQP